MLTAASSHSSTRALLLPFTSPAERLLPSSQVTLTTPGRISHLDYPNQKTKFTVSALQRMLLEVMRAAATT